MQFAVGAQHANRVNDLRIGPKPPLKSVDEIDQVYDRALPEAQTAVRHRKSLLQDMVAHHDLGAGGGLPVEMQRPRMVEEAAPPHGRGTAGRQNERRTAPRASGANAAIRPPMNA